MPFDQALRRLKSSMLSPFGPCPSPKAARPPETARLATMRKAVQTRFGSRGGPDRRRTALA